MSTKFKIGDLVRLHDSMDPDRQIGIITAKSPRAAHVVSHGTAQIYQVYWPQIKESDWEYDFFLRKLESEDLTKDKK